MHQHGSLISRFIRTITFIDLPIRRKFLLFGIGTTFWFSAMAIVACAALIMTHYRHAQMVESTLPFDNLTHEIGTGINQLENQLQHDLHKGAVDDPNAHRRQVDQMRAAINRLSLHLTSPAQSITDNAFSYFNRLLASRNAAGIAFLQQLSGQIDSLDTALGAFLERDSTAGLKPETPELRQLRERLHQLRTDVSEYRAELRQRLRQASEDVSQIVRYAINATLLIFVLAAALLILFTRLITRAFANPIGTITNQIHNIGTGDVDLSQKLNIQSADEIGTLSEEFNTLMDTVYGMTVFKKVIEDDSSLEDVYQRLGEVFERDCELEHYLIYEIDPDRRRMHVAYPPLVGGLDMQCQGEILNDCALCRAVKTASTISSFEFEGICRSFLKESGLEHVCIPIIMSGRPGVIVQFLFPAGTCTADINPRLFKAETYIKHSQSVIETKVLMNTLRRTTLVDTLTGLYNRRFLQEHAQQLINGVLRRKKQIGLIMADMDYFKQVNDQYGHDAGDLVLKDTAQILNKTVRDSDIVVRFGGEEFLILLVDTEPGDALLVAEKIRHNVQQNRIKLTNTTLEKTISLGVSEFPEDTNGFWQAIKYADVALYKAKENGRNQVMRFEAAMWTSDTF